MKFLFGIIGIYIGAIVDEWNGSVFGLFIGILAGALIQQKKRITGLEQQVDLIRSNLIDSRVDVTTQDEKAAAEPGPVSGVDETETVTTSRGDVQIPGEISGPEPEVTSEKGDVYRAASKEFQADTSPIAGESPTPPREPDFTDKAIAYIKKFFTTGNVVVKVGMIILFFGVAFLLKYAVDRNAFPIELRLAAVAAGGIVMLVYGWRLRLKKAVYALVLQGGATGVLYLTIFSAAKLYTVLPLGLAFFVMLALVVFSCLLAVIQDSRSLATFATVGGFLAPVLTSSGHGSHVALFSYYALLNAGVFGIAWYKAWRSLNWVGFIFTFVIASLWGYRYYQPIHFSTTEPFLILFYLFYVAIPVLYAHRQPPELKGLVDGSLVFGVPLVGFTLQSTLVSDYEFGQALSALAMGALYIVLARVLWNRQVNGMRMLTESFLALGVIFASLAIPFALDGRWTATAWALEGAGICWIGIRQHRVLPRVFGLLLQIGGAIAFLTAIQDPHGEIPILNSAYTGSLLIALCGLFTSYHYYRFRERRKDWEQGFHIVLLIWGLFWWFGAGFMEIDKYLPGRYELNASLFFIAASMLVLSLLGRYLQWTPAKHPPALLLPAMALIAIIAFIGSPNTNPCANLGFIAWTGAFAIQYLLLYRSGNIWSKGFLLYWHSGSLWLLIFMISWILAHTVSKYIPGLDGWGDIIWGLFPAICIFSLLMLKDRNFWPLQPYKPGYLGSGLFPVVIFSSMWIVLVCFSEADPKPLPYIPILNPQDITQLFAMLVIYDWLRQWKNETIPPVPNIKPEGLFIVLAGIAFIWLNSLVANAVHFYGGIRYSPDPMFHSAIFQASISIIWTLTAFSIMGLATRIGHRRSWFSGAALLGVVVLKLFIVDLADIGTVARIVSFMTVGILMLAIGYISPLPPKSTGEG